MQLNRIYFFHCLGVFIDAFSFVNVCIQVIVISYDKNIGVLIEEGMTG